MHSCPRWLWTPPKALWPLLGRQLPSGLLLHVCGPPAAGKLDLGLMLAAAAHSASGLPLLALDGSGGLGPERARAHGLCPQQIWRLVPESSQMALQALAQLASAAPSILLLGGIESWWPLGALGRQLGRSLRLWAGQAQGLVLALEGQDPAARRTAAGGQRLAGSASLRFELSPRALGRLWLSKQGSCGPSAGLRWPPIMGEN